MTTMAMSGSCASAARSQPSPPIPVSSVNRPFPTVSRVDTVRVPEVSQACGSVAPGRELGSSSHGRTHRTRPAPMPPTVAPGASTQYRVAGRCAVYLLRSASKTMLTLPATPI